MKTMIMCCITLLTVSLNSRADITDQTLQFLNAKPASIAKLKFDTNGFVDKTDMKGLVIRQGKNGAKMIIMTKAFFLLHPKLERVSINIAPNNKVSVIRYPNEIEFAIPYTHTIK